MSRPGPPQVHLDPPCGGYVLNMWPPVCGAYLRTNGDVALIIRDRIPSQLHILFAATHDPGDQLSIRIMHLGYGGLILYCIFLHI